VLFTAVLLDFLDKPLFIGAANLPRTVVLKITAAECDSAFI
jgi:hypothetical protein